LLLLLWVLSGGLSGDGTANRTIFNDFLFL
jgi:hypothetical protein